MKNRLFILFLLTLASVKLFAQDDLIKELNDKIDTWQLMLDELDGELDGKVKMLSQKQSTEATKLYLIEIDEVQNAIVKETNRKPIEIRTRLQDFEKLIHQIDARNYYLYNGFSKQIETIRKLQTSTDDLRLKQILRSDIKTALGVFSFFDDRTFAKDILIFGAQVQPVNVLKQYRNFAYTTYSDEIMDALAQYSPMSIIYYMGSATTINRGIRNVKNQKYVDLFMKIFSQVGSNSKAYLLMDNIQKGTLTVKEAHAIGRDKKRLFDELMKSKVNHPILAGVSVDDALNHLSLLTIKDINELHEETDKKRFKSVDTIPFTSEQLYTLMVYGEDEIYTSSFLGLFNRLMNRMEQESSYTFLYDLGLNKYRTFIKMCANYNTLPRFISKMKEWEKDALFQQFIKGLQNDINPLEQAVAVADTYGSLKDEPTKEIFRKNLKKQYSLVKGKNNEAEKLYLLLMELFHISSGTSYLSNQIMQMSTLPHESLFKDGKNVQQHFFFDDEDGRASFATFIQTFKKPGWKISYKKHYVLISSTSGMPITIYANTSKGEYDGIPLIREIFETSGRFPDLVVHRGHSYYVNTTVESLTPNTNLIIMGSCGGYNNIANVLNYAPDAQIITSKQVGTMWVNNQLIFTINEYMRKGKDITWDILWSELEKKIPAGKPRDRFQDYIPPHENMGAILIANYRNIL